MCHEMVELPGSAEALVALEHVVAVKGAVVAQQLSCGPRLLLHLAAVSLHLAAAGRCPLPAALSCPLDKS